MFERLVLFVCIALAGTCAVTGCGDIPSLGSAGGSLTGPNGAAVTVPAGALSGETALAIGLPPVGSSPALPPGVSAVSPTYALTPRGTEFAMPVLVDIPFDPAQVPSGVQPRLLRSRGEVHAGWQEIPDAHPRGRFMSAPALAAAAFVVVVRTDPPCEPEESCLENN